MKSTSQSTLIAAGLALTFLVPAFGQPGPPAPSRLEDITACSLDGDSVFIVTGRDATSRRYKYSWDAAIDALCNGKGFAIGAPVKVASAARPAATAAPAPGSALADFPADSQPLAADALARKVSGKIFDVQLQNGIRWRLDYKANGYLFVNVSTGQATSGPWRAEDGRLCSHMRGGSASCNEVREQGQRLYLKRDNGELIVLSPQ